MRYQVHVEPSGHDFTVEDGEPILDAALRSGLQVPYSCRGGSCGACRSNLLAGSVTYPEGLPDALSEEQRQRGEALLCQARAASDLRIEVQEQKGAEGIEPRAYPCRLVRKETLAHDVLRLYLKLPANDRMRFLAGQYIDFLLKDGRRRAFSLANAPHQDELLELHVRYVPDGDFTDYLFHKAEEKAILRIKGPFGQFYLREESDRPMIFVAGGTGFAPIKGILEHAFAEGVTRPMHLYWGARAERDLYLDELPRRWALQYPQFSYTPVLSEPLPEDHWSGRTGRVDEAVAEDYPDLSAFDVYAAGPPAMVHAGADRFRECGLDLAHYYSDAFEFAKDKSPVVETD